MVVWIFFVGYDLLMFVTNNTSIVGPFCIVIRSFSWCISLCGIIDANRFPDPQFLASLANTRFYFVKWVLEYPCDDDRQASKMVRSKWFLQVLTKARNSSDFAVANIESRAQPLLTIGTSHSIWFLTSSPWCFFHGLPNCLEVWRQAKSSTTSDLWV